MLKVVAISAPSRKPRLAMLRSMAASCSSSMNTPSSPGSVKSTSVVKNVAALIRSSPFSFIQDSVEASSVPPRQ